MITQEHGEGYPFFKTYVALTIESTGVIERINRIVRAHEYEFTADSLEIQPISHAAQVETDEPTSRLLSAKEEAIGILINLSFGTE